MLSDKTYALLHSIVNKYSNTTMTDRLSRQTLQIINEKVSSQLINALVTLSC